MKESTQDNTVTLDITGPHTAAQLDAVLRRLALLRANLTPEVPATRDNIEQTDATVLIEDKPGLVIAARSGGGFRLWLRHRGFGWLAYQVDDTSARGMADFVIRRGAVGKSVNLIEHDEPNRH